MSLAKLLEKPRGWLELILSEGLKENKSWFQHQERFFQSMATLLTYFSFWLAAWAGLYLFLEIMIAGLFFPLFMDCDHCQQISLRSTFKYATCVLLYVYAVWNIYDKSSFQVPYGESADGEIHLKRTFLLAVVTWGNRLHLSSQGLCEKNTDHPELQFVQQENAAPQLSRGLPLAPILCAASSFSLQLVEAISKPGKCLLSWQSFYQINHPLYCLKYLLCYSSCA